jgi:hypothetical protein
MAKRRLNGVGNAGLGLAGGDGIGDALRGLRPLIAGPACWRVSFRCHLAQALEQKPRNRIGHRALLAECRDPHRLDGRFIGTGGDFVHDGSFKGLVLAHGL